MKELLLHYAAYNVWANDRMIAAILQQGSEAAGQVLVSSFPTIRATMQHIIGAEMVWCQRLNDVEHPVWVGNDLSQLLAAACDQWRAASAELHNYLQVITDEGSLQQPLHYTDLRGNVHQTPKFMVLQHVFNHSTYHRGQLVTMLRQVGATTIPGTDYITYARGLGK